MNTATVTALAIAAAIVGIGVLASTGLLEGSYAQTAIGFIIGGGAGAGAAALGMKSKQPPEQP